jgi:putative FmdB family regulatory protein
MPLYEYECDACGQRFEVIRKFSDPPLDACTLCQKGPVRRLLSSPAIQFKGTGWYITDYAQKGKTDKGVSKDAAKPGAKSDDTKSGDTKASDGTSSATTTVPSTPTKATSSE